VKRKVAVFFALLLGATLPGCAVGHDDPSSEVDASQSPVDARRATDARSSAIDAAIGHDAGPQPDSGPLIASIHFPGSDGTSQRGGSGGAPHEDMCPTGEALIGFTGGLTGTFGYHGQLTAQCGAVGIANNGASYAVQVDGGATLPTRGLINVTSWARMCPDDHLVIGFGGRSGTLIDQLTFRCAPLSAMMAGNWVISIGVATELEPAGGSGGMVFAPTDCPTGQVGTGVRVRAGNGIDAFSLACGTPSVP
jgi:hypothetical protein